MATRRIASPSASSASGDATRRDCSRSSAATVCRLFFTRWWISRIVASLVMQLALPPAQLGDVAAQQHGADALAALGQRHRPQRQRDPRASTSVRHGARPMSTSGIDSSTVPGCSSSRRSHSTSELPDQVTQATRAGGARQRVRARVRDLALGVEADQPVARRAGRRGAGPSARRRAGTRRAAIIATESSAAST